MKASIHIPAIRGLRLIAMGMLAAAMTPIAGGARAQSFCDTLPRTLPNPAPAEGDRFGQSVAADGNLIVVGSFWDDAGATNSGSAYVFNAMTGALVATLSNPTPAANDRFGVSVAISGNLAVVGAEYDAPGGLSYSGTAYVFNARTGALTATLSNPEPTVNDSFGISVAISENVVVVGAIHDDGGATSSGTAYVFNAATGALTATLRNPDPATDDYFGNDVAISGTAAVIGALADDTWGYNAGRAYVFDTATGDLTATLNDPAPAASDQFGGSVSIYGNVAVVGAYGDAGTTETGTAHVFDVMTGECTMTLSNPIPDAKNDFGSSVAVSGNIIVVGAWLDDTMGLNAGAAYVFNVATGGFTATLNNPTPAPKDWFGSAVAVSGSLVVVGAQADDAGAIDAGSACAFTCVPVREYLLGHINDPTGLDLNLDGAVDIADEVVLFTP